VIGKAHRLEDPDGDRGAIGIEDERRVTETCAPPGINQLPVDVALRPAAIKSVELVVVRATWRQRSVRRQPVEGATGSRSALSLAVCIHVASLDPNCHQPRPALGACLPLILDPPDVVERA
jgi:hypothetical protein